MKSSLTYLAFFLLYVFGSCKNSKSSSNECFQYPSQIDSLGIRNIYDTARWYLYSWLGDQKDNGEYRGQFPITYDYFFQRNDTIELFFLQYVLREPYNPPGIQQRKQGMDSTRFRCSVAFNLKTSKPLWCFDINGFSSGIGPGDSKFDSTRTNSLLNFIKNQKPILDPCFLELAKKIGFFKQ